MLSRAGVKGSELLAHEGPIKERASTQKALKILTIVSGWVANVDTLELQKSDFMEYGRHVLEKLLRTEIAGYLEEKRLEMKPAV